jgi:hypothetical protein
LLEWLYERLTRRDVTQPADLIFVLAGKMERKRYGLELFHTGLAETLLLSVERFEVSKMAKVDAELAKRIVAIRDVTPPEQRHFFCVIEQSGTQIGLSNLRRWSTYGEALGLREYLAAHPAKRVLVVSTDIHLRRTTLSFEHVMSDTGVEFQYCGVPEGQSSVSRHKWWSRRDDRKYVVSESVKLAGYQAILMLPDFLVQRCMRLKRGSGKRG